MNDFKKVINEALGHEPEAIIPDGSLQRFNTNAKKKGDLSGWYVLHVDGDFQAGAFGDWRTDQQQTWCNKSDSDMSEKEHKAIQKRIEAAKNQRKLERDQERKEAKAEAVKIWLAADDAPDNHPYLERKDVQAIGIRQCQHFGDLCLVVPVRVGVELTSLQFIKPDGSKYFLKNGEVQGGVHILGQVNRKIIIAEGYSTAATINKVTGGGAAVALAFNAGNLLAAAKKLQAIYPECAFILAADNDHKKEAEGKGNAGMDKGRKAAEAINALFVHPPSSLDGTDFNDMAAELGLDAVRNIISTHDGRPWAGLNIPSSYICNKNGVFIYSLEKSDERLTNAPCWVSALSRDDVGSKASNWGRLVHWLDHDGNEHSTAVLASHFHAQGSDLAGMLAVEGLPIIHGKEKKLIGYLSEFRPKNRLLSAPATGWKGESFVLPTETINEPEGERVVYQPLEAESVGDAIYRKKSLELWQANVAHADASPLLRFAIAAALAAPMRLHADAAACRCGCRRLSLLWHNQQRQDHAATGCKQCVGQWS